MQNVVWRRVVTASWLEQLIYGQLAWTAVWAGLLLSTNTFSAESIVLLSLLGFVTVIEMIDPTELAAIHRHALRVAPPLVVALLIVL